MVVVGQDGVVWCGVVVAGKEANGSPAGKSRQTGHGACQAVHVH